MPWMMLFVLLPATTPWRSAKTGTGATCVESRKVVPMGRVNCLGGIRSSRIYNSTGSAQNCWDGAALSPLLPQPIPLPQAWARDGPSGSFRFPKRLRSGRAGSPTYKASIGIARPARRREDIRIHVQSSGGEFNQRPVRTQPPASFCAREINITARASYPAWATIATVRLA